jgi:hypothetical protein
MSPAAAAAARGHCHWQWNTLFQQPDCCRCLSSFRRKITFESNNRLYAEFEDESDSESEHDGSGVEEQKWAAPDIVSPSEGAAIEASSY